MTVFRFLFSQTIATKRWSVWNLFWNILLKALFFLGKAEILEIFDKLKFSDFLFQLEIRVLYTNDKCISKYEIYTQVYIKKCHELPLLMEV